MVFKTLVLRRKRWLTSLFMLMVVASLLIGAGATRADDPPTATPNNSVGGINQPPPPTNTPVATSTTVPVTATTPATATVPATAAASPSTSTTATPVGTAAAPAASPASPASSPASGTPTTNDGPVTTSSQDVDYDEHGNDGGGSKNIVKVQNKTDNRLRVKGKIQLNHIPGADVEPVNDAEAYGSCTNCQTFAVALQIDLVSRTATTVAPQNVAIALNVKCSHCTTVADAIQYVVPVDDPAQTPDNVKSLIRQMQQQLDAAARDKDATVSDTEAKINAVIAQFNDLGQGLYKQRDEKSDDDTPGATVAPDATILTPTPTTPAGTPSGTPTDATPVAMRPPEAVATLE